ncbi:transglycosylase SLT domain-containing protein [Streptomyces phyllanthi]|uniref:Lytic transglycosylase n=1 Tax=Streptomyces phyllanthi TaxID=1803180 RepID=A0A5N8WBV1_9ACTN|nr:transglycosylase SLT domain-containing protein [Streptomyces phyllanthi]MPY44779.1 lytic transglycosylase [Streptomyces phyllanthi]
MPKFTTIARRSRVLAKPNKVSLACVAGLGAASVGLTLIPGGGQASADAAPNMAPVAYSEQQIKDVKAGVTDQLAGATVKADAAVAKKKAADEAAKKADEAAKKKAAAEAAKKAAAKPAPKTYPNNLDGWIRESLDVMKKHGIPGSYDGIKRNILRESSGNPKAINNWDINAINGIPSKGLLQVIPPTFKAYHVPGTSWDIYNPVANITAACNYAADRYGSMDNVNSAY